MGHRRMIFRDREDAGERLAPLLVQYRDDAPIVLGLPRGGLVVAYPIARALGAPLDVWVARKLGAPMQPELGLGAIAEGGEVYLDQEIIRLLGVSDEEIARVAEREADELQRRVHRFRGRRAAPDLQNRTVILVDDGIATGGTARAAIRSLRRLGPRRIVLAAPVASAATLDALGPEVDAIVCLQPDPYMGSVGAWYLDFTQTTDDEVRALLDQAWQSAPAAPAEPVRPVHVRADRATLEGDLSVPPGALGLVLFAHGSGSGRMSPRNRYVAEQLRRAGLGTLLFDLLTVDEAIEDQVTAHLRFDLDLLARRLLLATEWVRRQPELSALPIGYFGASTGAGAALIAAAARPGDVGAVVSRGGRPDLAGRALERVRAPTLLLVGSADPLVLDLNQSALERMQAMRKLAVIPGASHLFEEPGALEEVARLAGDWFTRHLAAASAEARV